jgi:hypothetical protein
VDPGQERPRAAEAGRPGRKPARRIEAQIRELDAEIEGLHREGEAAQIAIYGIEADKAAATAEMSLREEVLTNQLEAEEGLREAVEARGDLEYEVTEQLYRNGGIWRGAMATTKRRFGRRHTPQLQDLERVRQDAEGTQPKRSPEPARPSTNGHKPSQHIDPDNVTRLT